MSLDIKKGLPHLIAIVVFVLVSGAYFIPQFSGKVITQNDIQSFKATSHELKQHRESTGEEALWTNSLFGGMPAYQISVVKKSNLLSLVKKVMFLGLKSPAGMFVFGMIGFYILLITLGVNPYISIVGAALYALGTNQLVLFEAGHNSKIQTVFSIAPIIAGVILSYRGAFIKGGTLFGIAMGMNLLTNHPQMTYYAGIALIPLVVLYLVKHIKESSIPVFLKGSAVLFVGLLLAIGSSATSIMTTLEYAKESMRGAPILKSENKGPKTSSETEGLEWTYAMNWSNGTSDLMASWIPKVVGGATVEYVSKDSPYAKALGQRKDVQTYTYFGGLPSTAGPVYYGAVVFFLFFLSLFMTKGVVRWWTLIGVVLLFMLSLGSNLAWFNRILFDTLPMFNKFRAPSSATGVAAVLVAFGAFYGLSQIFKNEDKAKLLKPLMIGTAILGGFTLLIAMIGPSLMDITSPRDAQFAQNPKVIDALLDTRAEIMRNSALRSLVFILITAGILYMYLKDKMGQALVIGGIAILGFIDLIPIDQSYVSAKDFVSARQSKASFNPRPVDTQILQDTDPHYRVMDTRKFNEAGPSYFHKHIGGYHPAKLQRYEDLKNKYIISSSGQATNNMSVISMLNTKYFIVYDAQNKESVQRNTAALGNAWFVNSAKIVENANQELDALEATDLRMEAVIHNEFKSYLGNWTGENKNGTIRLTSYAANELKYTSETNSEQLAVFSEVWYDKGWNAYIDGKKVDHIRTNYVLRGLKIPAGKHEIRFAFEPSTYSTGNTISLICSLLLILGGLGSMFKAYIPGLKDL